MAKNLLQHGQIFGFLIKVIPERLSQGVRANRSGDPTDLRSAMNNAPGLGPINQSTFLGRKQGLRGGFALDVLIDFTAQIGGHFDFSDVPCFFPGSAGAKYH
ncbi:hypothetical protein AAV35_013985 (plasmid) [Salimicrobium jeotgali]|uniref:Uncharacterized protein n=1 Tax=Salimicrobium jeotgali TaxID=1230341 RepID=K2FI84_9BACI|nr:hypothetical protein [Salimicrobium jeotgali]AKG05848.1 hypothetical protein AAV35_013985 [Salimicrobium jeotgali]EKE30786.1 hypothetical protein MJ3_11730 [Salimicrobium jeotgali]MBM7697617.1 hypothetical protein [Salimicrobium jeotgali]